LVDAADSKSAGAKHRAGSSPALGTNLEKPENSAFSGFFSPVGCAYGDTASPLYSRL
jgi:hypothetical protein